MMPRRVVVSGAASALGRLIVERLHRKGDELVVIDPRLEGAVPSDIRTVAKWPRSSSIKALALEDPDAWIHIAIEPPEDRQAWCSEGTQFLTEYLAGSNTGTFVYVSTALVYGANPDNPILIPTDAPLRGSHHRRLAPLVEGDLAVSSLFWKAPHIRTVILRPTFLLGPSHTLFATYLRREHPPVLLGFDPTVAPVSIHDVAHVVLRALDSDVRGIFNMRGPEFVPIRTILSRAGRHPVPVPSERMADAMIPGIGRFLKYPCIGDDRSLPPVLRPASFTPLDAALEETINAGTSLIPLRL